MTCLLASVTSVAEALAALDAGADLIDLKNPAKGALGALPPETLRAVVNVVAGRRPLSATVGDLPMQPDLLLRRVELTAQSGVSMVKLGLFGAAGHIACIEALAPLARSGVRLVAVLFADQAPDMLLLPWLARNGFYGVMLDTAHKEGGGLRQWLSMAELAGFVAAARSEGMISGLAGSLREEDIPVLGALAPDYLGFRGAICRQGRRVAALDPQRLQRVRALLRTCGSVHDEARSEPLFRQSDCTFSRLSV